MRALLRMLPPRRSTIAGSIRVVGQDVLTLDEPALGRLRGGVVAMIFQEPMLALDPVYTIGDQIAETVERHRGVSRAEGRKRDVVANPTHPYTRGLLSSTVHGAHRGKRLEAIPGAPPRLDQPPRGCTFAPRCGIADAMCAEGDIAAVTLAPGRSVRCLKLR